MEFSSSIVIKNTFLTTSTEQNSNDDGNRIRIFQKIESLIQQFGAISSFNWIYKYNLVISNVNQFYAA